MEGEPMEDRTVNGEVSPPSPNPCHSLSPSNAQCPSLWRSHLSPSFSPLSSQDSAAEDVIYAHLDLGTLSERRFNPTPLRPMHPSAEPIIYEKFEIRCKPRLCWALNWPHPMSTQSVTNRGPRSLVKGVLHGHSFPSKAAQQLWGEEWSPRITVSSSKIPPPLNDRLAILGLYCNYLTFWGDTIINRSY